MKIMSIIYKARKASGLAAVAMEHSQKARDKALKALEILNCK